MISDYSFVHTSLQDAAPTARRMPARGNAPGITPQAIMSALKGRRDDAPLQGAKRSVDTEPRALPWDNMRRRFQRREMSIRSLEPCKAYAVNPSSRSDRAFLR